MSSVWRSAGREMPRRLRSSRSRFAFDAALDLRLYFAFHVAVHRLSLPIFLPRFSSACVRSFLHRALLHRPIGCRRSPLGVGNRSPSSAFRKLKPSDGGGGERIVRRCQLAATVSLSALSRFLCPIEREEEQRRGERARERKPRRRLNSAHLLFPPLFLSPPSLAEPRNPRAPR